VKKIKKKNNLSSSKVTEEEEGPIVFDIPSNNLPPKHTNHISNKGNTLNEYPEAVEQTQTHKIH